MLLMSHQDYVSRPRTQNKKKNPYKKESTVVVEKKGMKSKLILIILFIIIAISIYGLWFLKNNTATKDPVSSIIKADLATENKTTALPTLPKQKWTYVDQLENKQVEVGEYDVTQHGPYKMQCGSFRSQAQAESLKAKMAFIGIESIIQKAQGKTSLWHQVVLGPYTRKRAAEKDKHKLKNNKINGCQIWLWK